VLAEVIVRELVVVLNPPTKPLYSDEEGKVKVEGHSEHDLA
jgi:hypothetical protein